MRNVFRITVVLFFSVMFLLGQEKTIEIGNNQKRSALQFSIKNLLSLSSFYGSMISYRVDLNNNKAYRIGISLSEKYDNRNSEIESGSQFIIDDTLRNYTEIIDRSYPSTDISITINYLKINKLRNNTEQYLYIGYGPVFGFDYYKYKDDTDRSTYNYTVGDQTSSYSRNGNIYSFRIGLNAAVGIERVLKDNIYISAEYNPQCYYVYENFHDKQKNTDNYGDIVYKNTDRKSNSIKISQSVRFGISLFF